MPPLSDVLVQLVLDLFRVHRFRWDQHVSHGTDRLMDQLRNAFDPVSAPEDLEQLLRGSRLSREAERWTVIYLRPPPREESLVPLLAGEFDFRQPWPVVRLQLGLFSLNSGDRVVSAGFRFETPEGPDRPGRHDFYHAQPIGSFAGRDLTSVPPSKSTPAIPVDAHDPIALVLCVLVSLYGSDGIHALSPGVRNLMQRSIAGLRVIGYRAQYYRVVRGTRTIICCSRDGRGIEGVRERHRNAQITECTLADYDDADQSDRDFVDIGSALSL